MTIGIAIFTHESVHHLPFCLPPLLNSPIKPRVLVVNTSSNDGTLQLARDLGAETLVIPRSDFNHGSTRERARRHLGTDIVVMMTHDAYAADPDMIEKLIKPIIEGKAAIAYARQVPRNDADFFESFPRKYNYPPKSQLRSLADTKTFGVYTFFCSDSCAAYLNGALDSVGGFPAVLVGEDTVVTAKLLRKGHRIAYVAEAIVIHSHHYTLAQEFQRAFDTGLARRSYHALLQCESSDMKRGISYVGAMLLELARSQPQSIPYALLHTAVRFTAYQLGRLSLNAPLWFKRRCSGQQYYWK
ncbi:MAG: glycosyltransferase family 2 protein [Chlamydiales bacterium]|nr:glycosyltransferase family 2 protein [Chlamydiia bacterium]MCP5507387.1 glycosyltransferase family 2 protein [Chlamydiales bacterium]